MSGSRAFLWTFWLLIGPLLLVCMTVWNGWPLPAEIPFENGALAVLGFSAAVGFTYVLPVWLIASGRKLQAEKIKENQIAKN